VALWGLQLYIVPLSKLPCSITGSLVVHFSIHLQPQDQDPIPYTITSPRSPSILGPRGHIFLTSCPGTPAYIHKLLNYCYRFFIFRYCSHRVFDFHLYRYLVIMHQHYPFRYIIDTGMQSFPLNINCIS
jgi:hypothetical protein